MTNRPNLNALSKEIFESNKAKGFHDKEHSNEHYLSLVISELYEAVEADRKELRANYELHYDITHEDDERHFNIPAFRHCIKGTVEDELADSIIRLLDLAGLRGYDLSSIPEEHSNMNKDLNLTENIYKIIQNMMIPFYAKVAVPAYVLIDVEYLAKDILQIDIWRHVELKLKYNATRERLHSKRY